MDGTGFRRGLRGAADGFCLVVVMTTWPDPARPGVPPAPGWYWIGHFGGEKGIRFFDGDFWRSGTYFTGPEDYAHLHLLGPVLTPDEALALQKRADQAALGHAREAARADQIEFLHKRDVAALQKRVAELEAALASIASNTCCDRCQEAALVARAALKGGKS